MFVHAVERIPESAGIFSDIFPITLDYAEVGAKYTIFPRLLSFFILPNSAFEPGACTGRTTIVPAAIGSTILLGKKPRKFTKQPNRAKCYSGWTYACGYELWWTRSYNVFINTLCSVTSARRVLLSADGAKIFHTIPGTLRDVPEGHFLIGVISSKITCCRVRSLCTSLNANRLQHEVKRLGFTMRSHHSMSVPVSIVCYQ